MDTNAPGIIPPPQMQTQPKLNVVRPTVALVKLTISRHNLKTTQDYLNKDLLLKEEAMALMVWKNRILQFLLTQLTILADRKWKDADGKRSMVGSLIMGNFLD